MAKTLEPGDKVGWRSSGGSSTGKVIKKLTSTTRIKGHTARPTEDEPQFLVESESGERAAHKPAALRKVP